MEQNQNHPDWDDNYNYNQGNQAEQNDFMADQQQGYPAAPYPYPAVIPNNGLATASLVMGILSIVFLAVSVGVIFILFLVAGGTVATFSRYGGFGIADLYGFSVGFGFGLLGIGLSIIASGILSILGTIFGILGATRKPKRAKAIVGLVLSLLALTVIVIAVIMVSVSN